MRPIYIRFARLRLISRSRLYCSRFAFVSALLNMLRSLRYALCAITKAICSHLSRFSCERIRLFVACRLRTFVASLIYSACMCPNPFILYLVSFDSANIQLLTWSMQVFSQLFSKIFCLLI